ncbi:MAG TPA: glutamine--fructose-6-phosphate transaminase (isomerizing) [Acidimicrobiales bacterium]|nr:glutamine--fructose-6-phosphate transaminase (isomerizing) [Acidimicrobiales bacterium]
MCGIIGATGLDDVVDLLVEGLERLEYRGYDSAGLVLTFPSGLWRVRAADGTRSVSALRELAASAPGGARAGLGHTRWATHGHPSIENAHPLFDCTGRVAVVHNGIIENHAEIGARLQAAGHTPTSATDTEVLAHLIEEHMGTGQSLAESVRAALLVVRGSFSIAVVSADEPELLVAARRNTPLVLGLTDGAALLASDIPALLGRTKRLFVLADDQLAELRPGSVRVTTLAGEEVDPPALSVDWDLAAAQKGGYEDFMSKEIREQPRAVADTLLDRRRPDGSLTLDEARLSDDDLQKITKVYIVACGSSYHAALLAKYAIEHWARVAAEVDIASEFRYRDPVLDPAALAVGVSQSGESLDTLLALREARRRGARVLAVTNVVDSSIAREADAALYTRAGPEICVAATKTLLAQIVALELLALTLAQVRGTRSAEEIGHIIDSLHRLPEMIEDVLSREKEVDQVAEALAGARDFFYLGRNVGYPVALEGALKLKELSYLHAEGYPAGELKHGPIALIEPGTVVVGIATRNPLWEKFQSNIAEVKSRGATVVLVANDGDERAEALADHVLWVPEAEQLLAPVVDIVPLQLFAYRLARLHGLDVDRPRNLAKTVTVE